MYSILTTNRFEKDVKRAVKRNFDISELKKVIQLLEKNGKLSAQYIAHKLKGNFTGLWECHIKPDWLLIWKQDDAIKLITLTRTGTHSDLF